jgi:hypothetical protein
MLLIKDQYKDGNIEGMLSFHEYNHYLSRLAVTIIIVFKLIIVIQKNAI